MLKHQNPSLPELWKRTPCKLPQSALPTPPPSSEPFSQDKTLISDLSDIEITSSPPPSRSVKQPDETSRKRKHWQIEEDATIIKMVLLRKLFPHRKDINWYAICNELTAMSDCGEACQPGRVRYVETGILQAKQLSPLSLSCLLTPPRSRFFSAMHSIARTHGISHRDLCRQLAMPFNSDVRYICTEALAQTMSEPIQPLSSETTTAMRKLNDLAFNAKLREARQALDAHRPDINAQRRASEGLRSMRSSQIPSSSPARVPGLNERMAAIPILSNPVPSTSRNISTQPPQSSQPLISQDSPPVSTQLSEAAVQLLSELKHHVQPTQKQEWEWSAQTRGYVPKAVPTLDQNMWRNSKEIYNSAIAYNVKVRKGKKKENFFVYENPLMTEQMKRKKNSSAAKSRKNAKRREGRGFEGPGRRMKEKREKRRNKVMGGVTSQKSTISRQRSEGSLETVARMKQLQVRLAAKLLGNK